MAGQLRAATCVGLILLQTFTFIYSVDAQQDSGRLQDALWSYLCRGTNARICSGNGYCKNRVCICKSGYSGNVCENQDFVELPSTTTTTEPETVPPMVTASPCSPADTVVCGDHGVCLDGACRCDTGWSGSRCEVSMRGGFCNAYRACAECMALLQTCPSTCTSVAHFQLVFGFPTGTTFHRCRQRSATRDCIFYYQLLQVGADGHKKVGVQACLSESTRRPPETTEAPPDTDDDDDNTIGDQGRKKGGAGDSGVSQLSSDLLVTLGLIILMRF